VKEDDHLPITKRILRDALRGLATLQENDLVHLNTKSNRIMVDWEEKTRSILIKDVQLADLEGAMHISGDRCYDTMWSLTQVGHWM
jgi:hypothetical protein